MFDFSVCPFVSPVVSTFNSPLSPGFLQALSTSTYTSNCYAPTLDVSCYGGSQALYKPSDDHIKAYLALTVADILDDLEWYKLTIIKDLLDGNTSV